MTKCLLVTKPACACELMMHALHMYDKIVKLYCITNRNAMDWKFKCAAVSAHRPSALWDLKRG